MESAKDLCTTCKLCYVAQEFSRDKEYLNDYCEIKYDYIQNKIITECSDYIPKSNKH